MKVEERPLESNAVRADAVQASVPLGGSANEEYYQSVVINSLLRVLQDPSLSTSSYAAIDALMSIFKTQGMKGAVYLDKVCRPRSSPCLAVRLTPCRSCRHSWP